jgi:outer membrane protein OmpA-like peptidoglycan-associated protein
VKPKGVWLSGLCSLALVCVGGLYLTLPRVEHDVQARVDTTLEIKGLTDVKATVSGQSVTLAATTNSPDAVTHLAQAKTAILDMHEAMIHDGRVPGDPLPGGQMVNGVVTEVAVNAPTPDNAATLAQIPAWSASGSSSLAAADAQPATPLEVAGEKATTIASSSAGTPPVAGDNARQASDTVSLSEAKACQDQIDLALGARRVDFVAGSYQLSPAAQAVLDDAYRAIETCPQDLKITVAAYTDDVGDPTAKQIISRTRAEVTADALVKRGLAAARVDAEGYGAASPVADNATPQGRRLNQRVAISVRAE